MNSPDHRSSDVDQQLDALHERCGALLDQGHYRSAYRAYGELGRLAKREGRVIPYIVAVFHQMDLAQYLLQPQTQREKAIELLGLLEDEEAARRIQSDLPEPRYEYEAGWRTACGYENLAEAAGMIEGFNSEGMHAIIAEGLQVCRRTGKLECVRCFREYATDVYAAADDLEIALHQCKTIIDHPGPWSDRGDRRWLAAKKAAWFHLLDGGVEQAEAMLRSALRLASAEGVGVAIEARQRVMVELAAVLILAGKDDLHGEPLEPGKAPSPMDPARETVSTLAARRLVEGENLMLDYRWDLFHALRACVRGDCDAALGLLRQWDSRFLDLRNVHEWFETRLRRIAAHRLAGRRDEIERLAAALRERALQANDWLTLRRLERLLDEDEPTTPLALLAPVSVGPFASAPAKVETESPAEEPAPAEHVSPEDATPLETELRAIYDRWRETDYEDEATNRELLARLLKYAPHQVSHPRDAARLLFLAGIPGNAESGRAVELWRWAQAVAERFPDDAQVANRFASLGAALYEAEPALADVISTADLDHLFRKSLRLDHTDAELFVRAGMFYHALGDLGEAERCFARGFRLRRDSPFLALRLAEVYQQTERPRDALAVLDLCLREGAADPAVAWEAALAAFALEDYDAALAYLDRLEELHPGQPTVQYFRGAALLELGRSEEALAALDEEQRRVPDVLLHLEAIRACVCLDLGRIDTARAHLQNVLDRPLREADFFSPADLAQLFSRLWRRAAILPRNDVLRARLDERLLAAGLMPDEYFEHERQRGDEPGEVNFYRCLAHQPLDARWAESPVCLPGQEAWREYFAEWGVLASSQEDAVRQVAAWQARCCQLPAEIEQVELCSEGFFDKAGVVWQGPRWPA